MSGEYDLVAAHLRAIRAGSPASRRRFRACRVECQQCNGLVAELWDTSPLRSLTYRQVYFDIDGTGDDTTIRRDEPRGTVRVLLIPDAWEDLECERSMVYAGCRCARHMLNVRTVMRAAAAGSRKVVKTPNDGTGGFRSAGQMFWGLHGASRDDFTDEEWRELQAFLDTEVRRVLDERHAAEDVEPS